MNHLKFPHPQRILVVSETGLLSILIIVLPFIVSNNLMKGNQTGKFFAFVFCLALLLLLRLTAILIDRKDLKFRSCVFDWVFLLYFIYLIFNRFFIARNYGVSIQFLENMGLAVFYVIFRTSDRKRLMFYLYCTLLAASSQAVYGCLQLYGVLPSHHSMFNSTGGFFNPGPFAGYLAGIFPVAVALYFFIHQINDSFYPDFAINRNIKPTQIIKLTASISIVLILIIIPALRSRASWLAIIVSLGYIVFHRLNVQRYLSTYLNSFFKKFLAVFVLGVLASALIFGLYHFKKDSADGRILVWKVTSQLFMDKPFTGIGNEKFQAEYMNKQAAFFEDNQNSSYILFADDITYTFNEFLKIATETGVVGLFFVLELICILFLSKAKGRVTSNFILMAARAAILSILVFSFFSYPSEILPIKLNVVLLLALAAGYFRNWKVILIKGHIKYVSVFVILLILLLCFPLAIKYYQSFRDWRTANITYNWELYDESIEEFDRVFPLQKNNGMFLINYGKALSMAGEHDQAIEVLNMAHSHLSNTILYTTLGDSYKALGRYTEAEFAYKQSLNMTPGRFYPLYLLAKLYDEWGRGDKVLTVAHDVFQKQVKVESMAIDEIKTEMQILINKWQ